MAALSQQQTEIDEKGAGRAFLEMLKQKYPNVFGLFSVIGSFFGFFLNGHFIVAFGHWIIRTAGRIAETALLLTTLWVTAANVAPDLVGKLGGVTVSNFNSLSLIAFSLLPEIIVFSAIILTYEHWMRFFRDRRASNPAWVWASLYTIPTGSFVIMTILTISSFVSNDGGAAAHATGAALVARCLSGWFYSLVELIYAAIGKRSQQPITPRQVEDRLAEIVATTRATLEQQVATLTTTAQQRLNTQVATIQHQVASQISAQVASQVAKIETLVDRGIASLVANASTQVAIPDDGGQGITAEQFEMLVQLINQQAATIQQLSSSLSEIKRETRSVVTEIREIRSFTHEAPAIQGPAATRALPPGRTIESDPAAESSETGEDDAEKPGQRVLRFLRECQGKGYKPTLAEIQQMCQVAKKTATTYRKSFYGEGESSQADEDE
jgi:hypothetical protein